MTAQCNPGRGHVSIDEHVEEKGDRITTISSNSPPPDDHSGAASAGSERAVACDRRRLARVRAIVQRRLDFKSNALGAGGGNRTPHLPTTIWLLYHLSYTGPRCRTLCDSLASYNQNLSHASGFAEHLPRRRRFSLRGLVRALAVVKCQSALVCRTLRSCYQAAISSMRVCLSGMRRSRHWDDRTPSC